MGDTDRVTEPVTMPIARECPFDPPAGYQRLRSESPVSPLRLTVGPGGSNGWLVTDYAQVRTLLADPRLSHRNELIGLPIPPPFPMETYAPPPSAPGAFNKMDAPDHTRYRRLLAGHFTVRRVAALVPMITRIAEDCLAGLIAAPRPADLVTGFADPLPMRVMCELLGVPESARESLHHHLAVISKLRYSVEELIESITVIGKSLDGLVAATRAAGPDDTLLGRLAADGDLTTEELVNLAWALLGGGFDTTANMIALGMFALLEHPGQYALARSRPELLDSTVEELLRYLTISHLGASRAALTDIELPGATIKAGQTVVLALSSANRDPEKFADPDRLDVTSNARGHVAFGHGLHQCIGQHLARATLRVAYRVLWDRLPSLRLAVPAGQIALRDDMLHYGVHALPVTWDD